MKIAIIGDSPLMLILANFLKKKSNFISIISDKKQIGGAWSYLNYKGKNISRQTNVVVPFDEKENSYQNKLNKTLKKYYISVKKSQGYHKPNNYLSKKNYRYDFAKLYKTKKNFKYIYQHIDSIKYLKNKPMIGNEIYDRVYLPYFNGITKFRINNREFIVKPSLIKSKHILIIFKKLPIREFIYTENFDHYLDRAQITKFSKFTTFTARVRLEHKEKNISSILMKSKISRYLNKNNLLKKSVLYYKNYYRNKEQIKILKEITKNTNIKLINSFQFFEGFLELNKKYLRHF